MLAKVALKLQHVVRILQLQLALVVMVSLLKPTHERVTRLAQVARLTLNVGGLRDAWPLQFVVDWLNPRLIEVAEVVHRTIVLLIALVERGFAISPGARVSLLV